MQKQKGITLIALIITVILLLILLGTSLGIVLRGDFFGKARKTAKMTDEKISNEGNTIEKGQNDWEQMEVDICSHIWGEERITLEPTCTTPGKKSKKCENCGKTIEVETPALGHIWGEERTILEPTCTTPGKKSKKCENCGKTIEVETPALGHNYENRVCTRCGDVEALVVGANIDYHEYLSESGGTVSSSYTSTKTTRGSTDSSDSNATYSVVNNSGIQWIVLGEENGQIKITTKNIVQPTSGGYTSGTFKYLMLQGQNGYTNSIDELNKISAVYGKGKYADTTKFSTSGGRSFKMEDLGYGALTRTASYKYARHSDGKVYRYEANEAVDGTSTTGGSYTTFNYMALDASNSTDETSSSHTWKSLSTTANSYVTMYQYTYSGRRTLSTEVSKADTYYWLASRALYCDYGDVRYNARLVYTDGYDSYSNFYASDGSNYYPSDYGVRPVVYLKSTAKLSNYSSTNGYTLSY